ncbi:MAG: hypothetical protein ACFBZ9_02195 [Sphingomonadales bacterium]
MKAKFWIRLFMAIGLCWASMAQAAVIVDFNVDSATIDGPYFEDGFVVEHDTDTIVILNAQLNSEVFALAEIIRFTREDDRLFSLTSFDYNSGSQDYGRSDSFEVLGFIDGIEVADYGFYETINQITDITVVTANATLIEELWLFGGGSNAWPVVWDNFVFEVNEPVSVSSPSGNLLFMLGVGCLGLVMRRRLKATQH